MVLKLQCVPESAGGLAKHSLLASTSVSDTVGLGWGPRIFIANKFPGDADSAAWQNVKYFENHWLTEIQVREIRKTQFYFKNFLAWYTKPFITLNPAFHSRLSSHTPSGLLCGGLTKLFSVCGTYVLLRFPCLCRNCSLIWKRWRFKFIWLFFTCSLRWSSAIISVMPSDFLR